MMQEDPEPYIDFWHPADFNHHRFPSFREKQFDPCMGSFVGRISATSAAVARRATASRQPEQEGIEPS